MASALASSSLGRKTDWLFRFWIWYSGRLKTHPYTTNMVSSCILGGVADTIAQTVARRVTHCPQTVPRRDDKDHHQPRGASGHSSSSGSSEGALTPSNSRFVFDHPATGLHDLRRTFIYMSYFLTIGSPLMLCMYRTIQHLVPAWTLQSALQKGFCTWMTGFISTPVLIAYVTIAEALFLDEYRNARSKNSLINHISSDEMSDLIATKLAEEFKEDILMIQKYRLFYYVLHWIPQFYYTPVHFRMPYATCALMGWMTISSSILHSETRRQQGKHPSVCCTPPQVLWLGGLRFWLCLFFSKPSIPSR